MTLQFKATTIASGYIGTIIFFSNPIGMPYTNTNSIQLGLCIWIVHLAKEKKSHSLLKCAFLFVTCRVQHRTYFISL